MFLVLLGTLVFCPSFQHPIEETSPPSSSPISLEDFLLDLVTNETQNERNLTDVGLVMRKDLKISLLRGSLSLDKEFAQLLKENRTEQAKEAIKAFSAAVATLRANLEQFGVDPLKTMEKAYDVVYSRQFLDADRISQRQMLREAIN